MLSRMIQITSGGPMLPGRPRFVARRSWRWLAPLAAAGVVAVLASGILSAGANPNLPPQTAAQLLASMGAARPAGFSGTVVEKAALGLPELPNLGGSSPSSGLLGVLSGSHTSRVWYAGQTKQRIALLDALGEQDVFRDGREVWRYDSNTRVATHSVLPAETATRPDANGTGTLTPAQAAEQVLAMIGPTTEVATDRAATVAGRAAYTLVLTPKDRRSRIGSVRIAVDGATRIPLGVQVIARDTKRAALDISFTRIGFSVPEDDFFSFTPPPNATVKQAAPPAEAKADGRGAPPSGRASAVNVAPHYTLIGRGWTTVVKVAGAPPLSGFGSTNKDAAAFVGALPHVSGSWGNGWLFSSTLASGLFTSDGRVFYGAVDPDLLYRAAAQK